MQSACSKPIRPNDHRERRATAGSSRARGLLAAAETAQGQDEGEEEVQLEDEHDEEDVAKLRSAPDPGQPTEQQPEEHRLTHMLFRQWCKWCVRGR